VRRPSFHSRSCTIREKFNSLITKGCGRSVFNDCASLPGIQKVQPQTAGRGTGRRPWARRTGKNAPGGLPYSNSSMDNVLVSWTNFRSRLGSMKWRRPLKFEFDVFTGAS
jgi:hypothetical protein